MRGTRSRRIGLRDALRGVAWAFRTQRNLRIEGAIGLAAVLLALGLDAPLAPVFLASGLVLVAEMANSAVELVVDLVSPRPHPLAGLAKDVAAGGALLAAATSVAVGLAVLGPPLLARLGGAP